MDLNNKDIDLYLASASPRRKELLESLGLRVFICPANIDETPLEQEVPESYVRRLALEKAQASMGHLIENELAQMVKPISQEIPCLGADTIVVCQGQLFGKPEDKDDAFRMWQAMSGAEHQVLTAVAVVGVTDNSSKANSREFLELSISDVTFKSLSSAEMETYWQTGEPQDKAGAYGIQGHAAAWVESIKGSYSGIMGLPLFEVNQILRQFGKNWL